MLQRNVFFFDYQRISPIFLPLIRYLSAYFVRLSADKSIFFGTYPLIIVSFLLFVLNRGVFSFGTIWNVVARYARERMLFSVYFCNVNEMTMIALLITLVFIRHGTRLKNKKLQ